MLLQHSFSAVVHLAGLKAVGESVEQPLRYYRVNLTASMNLLEVSVARVLSALLYNCVPLLTVLLCMKMHACPGSVSTNSNSASMLMCVCVCVRASYCCVTGR